MLSIYVNSKEHGNSSRSAKQKHEQNQWEANFVMVNKWGSKKLESLELMFWVLVNTTLFGHLHWLLKQDIVH